MRHYFWAIVTIHHYVWRYTVKKRLGESLVSDIPVGDANIENLFLQCYLPVFVHLLEMRPPVPRVWPHSDLKIDRECRLDRIREYWIIHRGPGFLAVVWFDSSFNPSSPVSKLSLFHSLPECLCCRAYWRGGGGGGGGGEDSTERTWLYINHKWLKVWHSVVVSQFSIHNAFSEISGKAFHLPSARSLVKGIESWDFPWLFFLFCLKTVRL